MSTVYLELDSTFRNRNDWPNPSEFQVSLSQKRDNEIVDPVCVAIPEKSWTGKYFDKNTLGASSVSSTILDVNLGGANSPTEIILEAIIPAIFQEKYNYYKHAVVRGINNFARIKKSEYLGTNRMKLVLVTPLTYNVLDTVSVEDPSSLPYLFVPDGSNNEQDYTGKLVYNESLNQSLSIEKYDATLGIILINGSTAGWIESHNYNIRKIIPNYVVTAGAGSTTSQIVLPLLPGDFTNWFIRVRSNLYDGNLSEARKIIQYTSPVATVIPSFSSNPTGIVIELMQRGYDNYNPITWRGSVSQEVPLYQVRLVSLILPNLPMIMSRGGNPSIANYFYVELTNVGVQNLFSICSNNPNSNKAAFRATVKDVVRLEDLEFISLQGDVSQLLRIRLDSYLHFKVTASDGSLFQTIVYDSKSPYPSKYKIQINALFECIPI